MRVLLQTKRTILRGLPLIGFDTPKAAAAQHRTYIHHTRQALKVNAHKQKEHIVYNIDTLLTSAETGLFQLDTHITLCR
jgi:hypothetical protein